MSSETFHGPIVALCAPRCRRRSRARRRARLRPSAARAPRAARPRPRVGRRGAGAAGRRARRAGAGDRLRPPRLRRQRRAGALRRHDGRGAGGGRRGAARRRSAPRRRVVVGDGFGALVALDLRAATRGWSRGVVLSDPPLFALVPEATRSSRRSAPRSRRPSASRRVPRPGSRRGSAAAPTPARWTARRRPSRGFFADYAGLASWPRHAAASCARLAVPSRGGHRPGLPPHAPRPPTQLAALLPDARRHDGDLARRARALL